MNSQQTSNGPPFMARMIRRLAAPIILGWLVIAFVLGAVVPPLEQVEKEHSVSMIPNDAPHNDFADSVSVVSTDFR